MGRLGSEYGVNFSGGIMDRVLIKFGMRLPSPRAIWQALFSLLFCVPADSGADIL